MFCCPPATVQSRRVPSLVLPRLQGREDRSEYSNALGVSSTLQFAFRCRQSFQPPKQQPRGRRQDYTGDNDSRKVAIELAQYLVGFLMGTNSFHFVDLSRGLIVSWTPVVGFFVAVRCEPKIPNEPAGHYCKWHAEQAKVKDYATHFLSAFT